MLSAEFGSGRCLLKLNLLCTVLMALVGVTSLASAQPAGMSGLCLDLREGGCTARFLPFSGLRIDFCEESCELSNPVNVRDLNGTLFDLSCVADYPNPPSGRVLILEQTRFTGKKTLSWIDGVETFEIVPCP